MASLDWLAVASYLAITIGIGVYFLRRASGSMEAYFVAGRSLPWWVIGFANCATYTGGSAAWVMLIFQDGLVGNFWWWPSWIVWMPLVAVLWARYWRRMRIVTTAEFIELRYGGRMAKFYRFVYALYCCLGWAPLVTGYMTGWVVVELQPILKWSKFDIILACGALVLVSTVLSGLLGVAYNQVFQLCFYLVGASLLIPNMLGYFGGWSKTVEAAIAGRGPHFMSALPPSASITPMILLALFIQGFFFAANPTAGEGSTAQRFMAARDETHAAVGQMLSTFLALVFRLIPFVIYGLVGAALFKKGSMAPEFIWSQLILKFAPPGLRGVLIAAELAGYMAIASAYVNWAASFLTNDVYKAFLRPTASHSRLSLVSKLTTVVMVSVSFLIALFLVEKMMTWFLYINSVMMAFTLCLAWLRFFWWRLNIWGEAAGVLLGLPFGYLIWFTLGFSQRPFWEAFFVLFVTGWITILLVTLLTPPERAETLRRFYDRCRPPGLWEPIASQFPAETHRRINAEFGRGLGTAFIGIFGCLTMVVFFNACFAGASLLRLISGSLMLLTTYVFVRRWRSIPATGAPPLSEDSATAQESH